MAKSSHCLWQGEQKKEVTVDFTCEGPFHRDAVYIVW